ncbi:peptide/nickel transport system ATP-binding protein [Salinibacterium amurskyense]|uniref:Peptide/nickel transport system ATP-binding protein n=1 Tax=Salinibacterium amurskyense TaxID=205941 RepID=A0A2M9D9A3_9MICO|nr:ABC transporter ATP-binding protein [Salinibacterium amurskyense]PJJ82232.1 peptide/nickel transport system ATP-binding protein [Salinibacterium amurskyense]RLQ81999.1 ABC transporter ATP-binding protein [Salinibacterium amurskyense]GHD77671.1 ABC transporter ATP-binding protein [Salinibacterium amurskyense]
MSELLEVSDLVIEYHGATVVRAVDEVSLTIAPGEVLALVGESGCGKSSLARAVVGMEKPRSGAVTYRDAEVPLLGVRRRKAQFTSIQMVFQDPNSSLNPRIRVGQQISEGIRAAVERGAEGSQPEEWLERVGLPTTMVSRYAHELSGGQRQRVAIARALAARPDLLVADEPISALDASSQASVADMMRKLALDAGAGLLFISHDLAIVRLIADRTVVMYRGKIVESGVSDLIWNDPVHPYTRALISAIPEPDGKGILPAAPAAEAPEEWRLTMPEALNRV